MLITINVFKYSIEFVAYLIFIIHILEYKRIDSKIKIGLIILMFSILNVTFSQYIYGNFLVGFIFLCLLINENIIKRIFSALMSIISISTLTFIPYYFIKGKNEVIQIIAEILIYLFIIVLVYLVEKMKIVEILRTRPLIGTLNIITLLFFVFSLYVFLNRNNIIFGRVTFFNLMLSIILWLASIVYCLIYTSHEKMKIRLENENSQKDSIIYMQETYYQSILENYENLRKFKHDISAYLATVQYLLNNKNYSELNDYLKSFNQEISEMQNDHLTNNDMINAVIMQLYNHIKDNNIRFEIHDYTEREIKMESIEIVSLFYNLLNNAIEAAKQSLSKEITITIKSSKNSVAIKLENSVSNEFNIEDIYNYRTSKNDKKNHGIGLVNMNKIIEKYDGFINYHVEEQLISEIIIFDGKNAL